MLAWEYENEGAEEALLGIMEVQPIDPAFSVSTNSKMSYRQADNENLRVHGKRLKSAHFNLKRDAKLGSQWIISSVKCLPQRPENCVQIVSTHIKSQVAGHPYHHSTRGPEKRFLKLIGTSLLTSGLVRDDLASKIKGGWAGGMAQWVEHLLPQPDTLKALRPTWWNERSNSKNCPVTATLVSCVHIKEINKM